MNYKHGMAETPTWYSFQSMHRRCKGYTETHKKHYVDKGISVCERWFDFKNFLDDMGVRPHVMTLDRIDNSKGYSPENCRWATKPEQMQNRSSTLWITIDGATKCVSDWSKLSGIDRRVITKRHFHLGWNVKDSVFREIGPQGKIRSALTKEANSRKEAA